jgi:hypothetical protein
MIITKILASLAVVWAASLLTSAAFTKRRGDVWDKVFNVSAVGLTLAVSFGFISLIWGI